MVNRTARAAAAVTLASGAALTFAAGAALMFAAGAALADGHTAKQAIVPEGMERAVTEFEYSPAIRAGDYVFTAGVVAGVPDTDAPTDEQMTAAFRRAFEAIATVLEAAGADWDDVVEMTTFHTDLRGQGDVFMAVKKEFVKAPFPAWTAIDIDRLWPDTGLTEIKVVAYAPVKD